MPIYLVGRWLWFIPFWGVGWGWLTANFPLVEFGFKSSGLGSVSASISYPSGFVFPLPLLWVVGETSTESLILAQDERWRRA